MSSKKYVLLKVTSEEQELDFDLLEKFFQSLNENEEKISLKIIEEFDKFPLCQ